MTLDTLITGGTIVTESGTFDSCLGIKGETIACLGAEAEMPPAEETIDASEQLVMPGVVDPHVHIDNITSIETWDAGSKAAVAGGITSILSFAWQPWEGEKSPWDRKGSLTEAVEREKQRVSNSLIDYGFHATLTHEDDSVLDELPELVHNGIQSIKIFTAYEFGLTNGFIHRVFSRLSQLGGVATVHTEDQSVCKRLQEEHIETGRGDPEWYPSSRPPFAEAMAVDDALRMAADTGVKYYGMHTSCREAMDVFEQFQQDGHAVRGETCTQYTALEESIYESMGCLPIIAPPIRTADDNDAMFESLQDGVLDVVSTDHVAFKRGNKTTDNWWNSKFGANGLQTSLPVFHHEAVNKRGCSYPFLVRVMCASPARLFGFPNKGTLEPGTDADIVLFDPDRSFVITAVDAYSEADYSLFENKEVHGQVTRTLVRGTTVYRDGEIVTPDHTGQFVNRQIPSWEE